MVAVKELMLNNVNVVNVGYMAPTFTLLDQKGTACTLLDEMGRHHVVLVFCRGSWCPASAQHLIALNQVQNEFAQRGAVVWAVSAERQRDTQRFAKKEKINFPLLEDKNLEVITRWGVRSSNSARPVPHPATFLIDIDGIVRLKEVSVNEVRYSPPSRLIEQLALLA